MDRNTTYKSGTTPSAYPLSTLAQYYGHPGLYGYCETIAGKQLYEWQGAFELSMYT